MRVMFAPARYGAGSARACGKALAVKLDGARAFVIQQRSLRATWGPAGRLLHVLGLAHQLCQPLVERTLERPNPGRQKLARGSLLHHALGTPGNVSLKQLGRPLRGHAFSLDLSSNVVGNADAVLLRILAQLVGHGATPKIPLVSNRQAIWSSNERCVEGFALRSTPWTRHTLKTFQQSMEPFKLLALPIVGLDLVDPVADDVPFIPVAHASALQGTSKLAPIG